MEHFNLVNLCQLRSEILGLPRPDQVSYRLLHVLRVKQKFLALAPGVLALGQKRAGLFDAGRNGRKKVGNIRFPLPLRCRKGFPKTEEFLANGQQGIDHVEHGHLEKWVCAADKERRRRLASSVNERSRNINPLRG
jgi:hypothetical protein